MAEPSKGGQTATETDPKGKEPEAPKPTTDNRDAGGKPPANPKDEPKPDDGKGPFRAKEAELADAKAELAKLRGELSGVKSGSDGLRKVLADAEAKAKKAEDAVKAAEAKTQDTLALANKKVADLQAALRAVVKNPEVRDEAGRALAQIEMAGGHQPPRPPRHTAVAADGPSGPGTQPETNRPTPQTATQPVRREPEPQPRQPDPPRPTRTDGDGHGGQCCCHPWWTTVLWVVVGTVIVLSLGMLGWWLATKSSSSAKSDAPMAITATAPDPLAADKGEFLTLCLQKGGTFEDCLNGFEAVTR